MITFVGGNKWDTGGFVKGNYFDRGDSYMDIFILCNFIEPGFMHFRLCMLYFMKRGFKNIDINIIHLFLPKHTLFAWDALQVSEVQFITNIYWQRFLSALYVSSLINVTKPRLRIKSMKLGKVKGCLQPITAGLCWN